MKQIVRLTEGDLHRIVKESVNRVLKESQLLTELDPRTYASYAKKRAAQGQMNKAKQGQNSAAEAFNQQYGWTVNDSDGNVFSYNKMYPNKGVNNGYTVKTQACNVPEVSPDYYDTKDVRRNPFKDNGGRGYNVADQMERGNGQYIKGQGWQ